MTNTPTDAIRPQEAAEAKSTRPTWLTDGCPPWCDHSKGHAEHDHYGDRFHFSAAWSVVMTAVEDRVIDFDDEPDTAQAYLRQHYREVGPRVEVCRDEGYTGLQFTPDEAEEFAYTLLELVNTARAYR